MPGFFVPNDGPGPTYSWGVGRQGVMAIVLFKARHGNNLLNKKMRLEYSCLNNCILINSYWKIHTSNNFVIGICCDCDLFQVWSQLQQHPKVPRKQKNFANNKREESIHSGFLLVCCCVGESCEPLTNLHSMSQQTPCWCFSASTHAWYAMSVLSLPSLPLTMRPVSQVLYQYKNSWRKAQGWIIRRAKASH